MSTRRRAQDRNRANRRGQQQHVDHRGRVTALVADAGTDVLDRPGPPHADPIREAGLAALKSVLDPMTEFAAIAVHHTATTDSAWSAGTQIKNLPSGDKGDAAKLKWEYAWIDPKGNADTKTAYSFPHHMVGSDGKIGAANTKACSSIVGILNGGRGGTGDWSKDRQAIFNHAVAHLKDSGAKPDDLPKLKPMAEMDDVDPFSIEEFATDMGIDLAADKVNCPTCSGKGTIRGGNMDCPDCSGDGKVTPEKADKIKGKGKSSVIVYKVTPEQVAAKLAELRNRADLPDVERTKVKLTDYGQLEVELPVEWDEATEEFVLTAAGSGVPQIVDNPGGAWHAVLCVEGLMTDESVPRELLMGACNFPDLPVPLRIQIEDEGGHYGAMVCGRIDTMERQEQEGYNSILGTGVFGTDETGQLAQLLVEEQTQRFVSIDPRDVDMEIVEVQVSSSPIYGMFDEPDDEDDPSQMWLRFSSLTIGAATLVATPAFQQAVMCMADQPLPETPIAVGNAGRSPILASAGIPTEPPAEWFEDPQFHVGDSRLVRQRGGKYACPLTITDDGHVFGHVCYWGQTHTAFPGKTVSPPKSNAALAHYLTGPGVKCDNGETVYGIGQITMGCGHASIKLAAAAAKAHYDGGYGAVTCADVRAGEDEFGVWISGALRSDLTEEQLREFRATNLSGDWRQIGPGLELIAVLAGVQVPGFPISRMDVLTAAADIIDAVATRWTIDSEGEPLALVAAGMVQRIPMADRLAHLESVVDVLMRDRQATRAEASRAALAEALLA